MKRVAIDSDSTGRETFYAHLREIEEIHEVSGVQAVAVNAYISECIGGSVRHPRHQLMGGGPPRFNPFHRSPVQRKWPVGARGPSQQRDRHVRLRRSSLSPVNSC